MGIIKLFSERSVWDWPTFSRLADGDLPAAVKTDKSKQSNLSCSENKLSSCCYC